MYSGIARNSCGEITASCCGEHIRESDSFLDIPRGSDEEQVFSHTELIDEPDYHKAIAPVSHQR